MNSEQIPAAWSQRTLRELHAGGLATLTPLDTPEERFEYYSIPAYQNGAQPFQTPGRHILSNKLLIPDRCLLFGKLNPRVEKVWSVNSTSRLRRLASTEWLPLVPTEELDQGFGFYLLRSEWVMDVAKTLTAGSTPSRQRVEPRAFYDIVVPLPPIGEQRAIAAQLALVDAAISRQDDLVSAAADLKTRAMRALFMRGARGETSKDTDIGEVPESWDVVPLGSLGRVGNGSTPKKAVRDYWDGGDFPWLTSAKVYDRDVRQADHFVTAAALRECHLPIVEPGALLIAITGQGKTLGHCAVLRTRATISQHVAYVATDLEKANPSFVRAYLETQYDYFRQVGAGGGSTKGALTCAFLRNVPIPLPPTLEEQEQIVGILDAIEAKTDLHRRKRAGLADLFKTLLHKLMTGEIRVADLDLSALSVSHEPEVAA